MPVVFNTINRPASQLPADAAVVIELVGEHGRRVVGYVPTLDITIEGAYRPAVAATTFRWDATLVANSLIEPVGTQYKVTERVDDVTVTHGITVPAGDGPYHVPDILEDGFPGALASPPLQDEIERALAAEAALQNALGAAPDTAAEMPFSDPDFDATNVADAIAEAAAGVRITELDAATAVTLDDLLVLVDEPGGVLPVDKSVTADVLRQFMATGNSQVLRAGAGLGVTGDAAGTTTLNMAAGLYYIRPFRVRKGGTPLNARVRVTTAVASANVRMGLYTQPDHGADPLDLTLLHDVGNFDASAIATVNKTSLGWAIPDNTLIWLVIATTAAGVAVTANSSGSDLVPQSVGITSVQAAFTQTGFAGTMPATLTVSDTTYSIRMPAGIIY